MLIYQHLVVPTPRPAYAFLLSGFLGNSLVQRGPKIPILNQTQPCVLPKSKQDRQNPIYKNHEYPQDALLIPPCSPTTTPVHVFYDAPNAPIQYLRASVRHDHQQQTKLHRHLKSHPSPYP